MVEAGESGAPPPGDDEITFYYNDELKEEIKDGHEYINEFKKLKKVGQGAFSKVYRVERRDFNEETGEEEIDYFAMKALDKELLRKQHNYVTDEEGNLKPVSSLDQVYHEIDVWKKVDHPYIIKIFELIDDKAKLNMYLIMRIADMGQIADYDHAT